MIKYNFKTSLCSLAAFVLLTGCGENKIDVLAYPTKIKMKVNISEICMPQYKSVMPTVAVIEVTNNSTFGKAHTNQTNSTSVTKRRAGAIAGILTTSGTLVLGAVSGSNTKNKSNVINVKRDIDAKLSASLLVHWKV